MSVQIRALCVRDPTGRDWISPVLSPTRLEPRGGSDGIEKPRTPVALPLGPPLRPRTPVVDRTEALPLFTTLAVPTIRPPRSRTEICRSDSGNNAPDVLARA